jgi:hypothetical protein
MHHTASHCHYATLLIGGGVEAGPLPEHMRSEAADYSGPETGDAVAVEMKVEVEALESLYVSQRQASYPASHPDPR